LDGHINTQNSRFWSTKNPRDVHQRTSYPSRVTVWCGVTAGRIIGPYFFENAEGKAETVNGERYRRMVEEFLIPELQRHEHNFWFQQDGAPAHTARATIDLLKRHFPGKPISKFGDLNWPPRSPDLTAPDFFLWGFLKDRAYLDNPQTPETLKANIIREVGLITPNMLQNVMQGVVRRARLCEQSEGGHLTDTIFHN
jgi:hypothetical protein